ncbi:unnamed protein product [Ixodes persulcatus]
MSSADGDRPPAQPQTAQETNPTPSPPVPGLPPPTASPKGECTKVPTSSSSASEINMDIAYLTPGQRLHDFSDSDSMGTTDDEGFILQLSKKVKKRRPGAQSTSSSSSTIISIENKSPALTVIYMPIDQTKIITKLNELKLTELLESHAPASVIQIRPNYRLNLLSVDTRNMAASSSLLKVSSLLGIPVRAFEPRSPTQATGVIKGIDATIKIDSKDTIAQLRSNDNTPVISARRLGTSASVAITFASPRLPDYIFLGLVRHKVELFVEKPIQCHRCSRFGHTVLHLHANMHQHVHDALGHTSEHNATPMRHLHDVVTVAKTTRLHLTSASYGKMSLKYVAYVKSTISTTEQLAARSQMPPTYRP